MSYIPRLSLCESFVLPVLTYGCDGLDMSVGNVNRLSVCWNDNIYRKKFGFHRWESVKHV